MVALFALAAGAEGWMFIKTTVIERLLLIVAGLLLIYPSAWLDAIGLALLAGVIVLQLMRRRPRPSAAVP